LHALQGGAIPRAAAGRNQFFALGRGGGGGGGGGRRTIGPGQRFAPTHVAPWDLGFTCRHSSEICHFPQPPPPPPPPPTPHPETRSLFERVSKPAVSPPTHPSCKNQIPHHKRRDSSSDDSEPPLPRKACAAGRETKTSLIVRTARTRVGVGCVLGWFCLFLCFWFPAPPLPAGKRFMPRKPDYRSAAHAPDP